MCRWIMHSVREIARLHKINVQKIGMVVAKLHCNSVDFPMVIYSRPSWGQPLLVEGQAWLGDDHIRGAKRLSPKVKGCPHKVNRHAKKGPAGIFHALLGKRVLL